MFFSICMITEIVLFPYCVGAGIQHFLLSAWLHRWVQSSAYRLMARELFSRFQCNQQPWQIGRLPLVGQAVFPGAVLSGTG